MANPYLDDAPIAPRTRPANPYLDDAPAPAAAVDELGAAPAPAPLGEAAPVQRGPTSRGHRLRPESGVYGPLDSGPQMRASTIENTPRTWGQRWDDFVANAQAGMDNTAAAISEAPVHALNLGIDLSNRVLHFGDELGGVTRPDPRMVDQPEITRQYAAGKRASAEQAAARVSVPGQVRDAVLGDTHGFLDTLALAAQHPDVLVDPAGNTLGAMAPGLVAGPAVPAQLAAQAVSAGATNAHQVEATLIEQGVDPDVAARTASEVFGASTALNYAIPRAVPGGQAVEQLLARTVTGEATQGIAGSAAARFLVPTLGETAGEAIPEGLDQVLQNAATGRPLGEGVGQQTALGAILGAPGGVTAGTVDAIGGRGRANVAGEPERGQGTNDPVAPPAPVAPVAAVAPEPAAPKPRIRVNLDGTAAPAPAVASESAPPASTARPSSPSATETPAGQTAPEPAVPAVSPDVATPAQARDPAAPVSGAAPTVDGVPAAEPKVRLRVQEDGSLAPVTGEPLPDQPASEPASTDANVQPAPAASEPSSEQAANEPRATSTGTKNATMEAERAAEGRDPVLRDLAKTNESTLAEARTALEENPSRGAEVVQRLRSEGTGEISLADEAVLLVDKVRLRNERDAAAARASDPAATEEARAVARRQFDETEARINEMDQATLASGREWGRLGQFRQRMLREDFTFEALERKERVREGRPLTVEESAKLKEFADRVQQLEAEVATSRQQLDEATAREGATVAYRGLVQEMAKALNSEQKGRPRLERLRSNAEESRAALRKMLGRTNAGVDPKAFYHLARIGAFHIADGALKLADWLGRMKAELGPKIFREVEPALSDVFKAAQALGKSAAVKAPADVAATIDPESITHRDVVELARAHILAGVKGEGEVMKATHTDLQQLKRDITEREVRRLFSDYGQVKFPSKDTDKVALRELRALVQLQESIDRLQEGNAALKTGPQRDKATQAIREKRKALDELLKKQAKSNAADPEKLATYQQARAENLRHQIEDLEKQLATGERPPKGQKPLPSEEVARLTEQRDALRKQLDAIDHPAMSPDERYQRGRAASIKRQLEQVQQRLAANDYARRTRPEPKALNEANTQAQFKLAKLKEEFLRKQFESEMAKRHPLKKILGGAAESLNLARAIMTSIDFSALLRQGGFIVLGHPIRGVKAIPAGILAALSQKREFAVAQEIASRENAPLYKKYGLELTNLDAGVPSLSKMEEAFMSRWLDKLPNGVGGALAGAGIGAAVGGPVGAGVGAVVGTKFGGLVRGSGRAYSALLNRLRADAFDALVYSLAKDKALTQQEGEAIAHFINVATGRGNLNPLRVGKAPNTGAQALNVLFFAPRLVASRFNLLAGQPLYGGTMRTRRLVAEEYARFLTGAAVVIGLAAMAAGGDDEDKRPVVSFDPRGPNFLKVRWGNTYLDPMAGLSQVSVFVGRELTGQKAVPATSLRPERIVPLASEEGAELGFGASNRLDVAQQFIRTKLAPVPSAVATWANDHKDVTGQDVSNVQIAQTMVAPMSLQNIAEIMEDNGVPRGAAALTLSMLGMGVQYRGARKSTEAEVEAVKKLGIEDKIAAWDRKPDATDSEGRDLRTIILASNWQEQVAKLPKAEREKVLAKLEAIRAAHDPSQDASQWVIDRDGQAREMKAPPNEPIDRQFIAWQEKRAVNKALRSVRSSFGAGDEEAARKRLAELRGVLGEDIEVEVGYDENDQPKLTLRGAGQQRQKAVETALRSAP